MLYVSARDARIPALGFGTYRLTGASARTAVAHALDLGYRHLDTAQAYDNEDAVGAALATSGVARGDVWITTKVAQDALRAHDVRRSTEASLRRLGTEYVDLLLVHWPHPEVPLRETLGAMQALRTEGKARHLGVSNFPPALLREALAIEPALLTNQVEYHPFLSQRPLLDLARSAGMTLTAYSPIARGRVLRDETLVAIAEAHGKTAIQVTLRWLIQQDGVLAIPKAASPEHRAANIDLFDFALSAGEMAQIHALARDERLVDPPLLAPDWDT